MIITIWLQAIGSPLLLPLHARNKKTVHIKSTVAVTWSTDTAGADQKFLQKGVWGEKRGIEVKISKNVHVCSDKRCTWFCFI